MTIVDRMTKAALLDVKTYEEVEANEALTGEAATVVGIVAVAQGIGAAGAALLAGSGVLMAAVGLVGGIVASMLGWVIWSYLTYFIGTNLFKGTATPGELMRTIGYAQTPGLLGLLRFIPFLGPLVTLVGAVWTLVAGVIAIRQALDVDTPKAVVTALIGWAILIVFSCGLAVFLAMGGALLGGVAG